MSFPRYEAYKDSGVDWLGDVPAYWTMPPLWSLFRRVKRTGFPEEELLSVYRDYGVIVKSSRDDNFNKPSDDLDSYQLVEPGDLAINKMKAWQGSVGISEHRGIVSPAYFVYKALHTQSPRYLHYLMRSPRYTAAYLALSKGIRVNQWDIDPQYHSRMPVLLPSLPEQSRIAAFLDRETAKIDALVAEQQRLIALLKEKRQAVISHAVTKGLNPHAPMKDSGVEWLGEVPAHWEVKQLRYVGLAMNGLTYDPADIVARGDGTLVLRSSNVQGGVITLEDNVYVRSNIPERLRTRIGDILICSRNGSRALIGKNAPITRQSEGMTFGAFMMIFRSKFHNFLRFVFNSELFAYQSALFLTSTINQLTMDNLYSFKVPLPLQSEQDAIAAFLDRETAKIDTLTDAAERAIALLQERRSALISAAVTGKIDVRGLAPLAAAAA